MSCQECQERLPGYAMQALPEGEVAPLEEHLASCAACASELETVRGRLGMLREWADPEPVSDLASRTVARLAAEPAAAAPGWKRLLQKLDRGLQRFAAQPLTARNGVLAVLAAMVLLVPALAPNWSRGRSSGAISGCRANLRLLVQQLDRYAADHEGRYPARLEELRPGYVRAFPDCPSAGRNTYEGGYAPTPDRMHYALACQGHHHRDDGVPADEPLVRK